MADVALAQASNPENRYNPGQFGIYPGKSG